MHLLSWCIEFVFGQMMSSIANITERCRQDNHQVYCQPVSLFSPFQSLFQQMAKNKDGEHKTPDDLLLRSGTITVDDGLRTSRKNRRPRVRITVYFQAKAVILLVGKARNVALFLFTAFVFKAHSVCFIYE